MTEKQMQDGKKARQIVKKHLNNLKEEFKENGFEITELMSLNGSFGWRYLNDNTQQNN